MLRFVSIHYSNSSTNPQQSTLILYLIFYDYYLKLFRVFLIWSWRDVENASSAIFKRHVPRNVMKVFGESKLMLIYVKNQNW